MGPLPKKGNRDKTAKDNHNQYNVGSKEKYKEDNIERSNKYNRHQSNEDNNSRYDEDYDYRTNGDSDHSSEDAFSLTNEQFASLRRDNSWNDDDGSWRESVGPTTSNNGEEDHDHDDDPPFDVSWNNAHAGGGSRNSRKSVDFKTSAKPFVENFSALDEDENELRPVRSSSVKFKDPSVSGYDAPQNKDTKPKAGEGEGTKPRKKKSSKGTAGKSKEAARQRDSKKEGEGGDGDEKEKGRSRGAHQSQAGLAKKKESAQLPQKVRSESKKSLSSHKSLAVHNLELTERQKTPHSFAGRRESWIARATVMPRDDDAINVGPRKFQPWQSPKNDAAKATAADKTKKRRPKKEPKKPAAESVPTPTPVAAVAMETPASTSNVQPEEAKRLTVESLQVPRRRSSSNKLQSQVKNTFLLFDFFDCIDL